MKSRATVYILIEQISYRHALHIEFTWESCASKCFKRPMVLDVKKETGWEMEIGVIPYGRTYLKNTGWWTGKTLVIKTYVF